MGGTAASKTADANMETDREISDKAEKELEKADGELKTANNEMQKTMETCAKVEKELASVEGQGEETKPKRKKIAPCKEEKLEFLDMPEEKKKQSAGLQDVTI